MKPKYHIVYSRQLSYTQTNCSPPPTTTTTTTYTVLGPDGYAASKKNVIPGLGPPRWRPPLRLPLPDVLQRPGGGAGQPGVVPGGGKINDFPEKSICLKNTISYRRDAGLARRGSTCMPSSGAAAGRTT